MYDPKGKFDRDWDEGHPSHVNIWESSICPSLKRLELKYERWFRRTDRLDMLPPLMAIGWSRRETVKPLESFCLYFRRSDMKWKVLTLDSSPDVVDFAALDIPQLKAFQGFSSLFKSCVTATATSVMVHTNEKEHRLPDHLPHTLPIFEPYFCRLSVLRILSAGDTFDTLPNFLRLEELELSAVDIPSHSINAGLPLSQTLRRLSLHYMTLTWMDGCVFTRLKRLYLNRVSIGEHLSVGLPVCTHIKYVGDDFYPLQSIFRVPTLIELIKDDAFSSVNFSHIRLFPTRTLLLRGHHYVTLEYLIAGIVSLVELEVLNIQLFWPTSTIGLLTALGRTIAEIGIPALRSAEVTLDENVVDDEYGEDAGTLSRGQRSLICPNLRQFALRVLDAGARRKEIEQECKEMVDTRRRAGLELECCRIWWGWDTTPSIVLDMSSDGFEVKW